MTSRLGTGISKSFFAGCGDDGYLLVAKSVIDSGRYNIVGGGAWSTTVNDTVA